METVTITMRNQIAAAQSRPANAGAARGYLAFPGMSEGPPPAFNRMAFMDFAIISEGLPDRDWDDFCPAYALGFLTYEAYCRHSAGLDPGELEARWECLRGASRLGWDEVCSVITRSWKTVALLEQSGQI